MFVVGVSGHRPDKLDGYSTKASDRVYNLARDYISLLKPDQVITGMSIGWETAVAKACADLFIPFIAAIPYKNQEVKWPDFQKEVYYKMLDKASEVVNVSGQDTYDYPHIFKRNKWVVNNSDLLLALWNGSDGWTNDAVWYATLKNKHIWNIWEVFYHEYRDR